MHELPPPFRRLTGLFFLVVLGISAMQLAALYSFFADYLNWPTLLTAPLALILAGIPIVSAILSIIAAHQVWHWELWQALALMGAPTILWLSMELISWFYRALTKVKR